MEYLGSLHTASRIYIGGGTISAKNIQVKYTMAKTWFPKGGCLFIICIGAWTREVLWYCMCTDGETVVHTSSGSRGFVSWSLSNVVSPALTRVVLSVRPQREREGTRLGWERTRHTFTYTERRYQKGREPGSGRVNTFMYKIFVGFINFPLPILSSCLATYLEFSHSLQGQRWHAV